jgi:hypothetical protein
MELKTYLDMNIGVLTAKIRAHEDARKDEESLFPKMESTDQIIRRVTLDAFQHIREFAFGEDEKESNDNS